MWSDVNISKICNWSSYYVHCLINHCVQVDHGFLVKMIDIRVQYILKIPLAFQ